MNLDFLSSFFHLFAEGDTTNTLPMAVLILHLALALGLGLLSTRLMRIIKLPNVTGYLLIGILIGPMLLGKIKFGDYSLGLSSADVSSLSIFSDIALGFIALTIGTSFRLDVLKKTGKKVIVITIFEGLTACFVVMLTLIIVHFIDPTIVPLPVAFVLGAIATATAPAATLMVVRQYRARGPVVSTLLPVVALDDAVALMAYAVFFSIAKVLANGGTLTVVDLLIKPIVVIIASLSVGFIFGFLAAWLARFFKSRANRLMILIFFVFTGVGIAKISWWGTNFSALLLCMMIGASFVNFRADGEAILEQVDRWTPPLFMFFFILSGASLIFSGGTNAALYIVLVVYIFARVSGKFLGAFIGGQVTNSDPSVKKHLGWTLIPQAGVAIGLATQSGRTFTEQIGGNFNMTYGQLIVFIILAATIVYEISGPIVTKFTLKAAGEFPDENNVTPHEREEALRLEKEKAK